MYLHIRKYQLVNARWRDVIDLTDYEETIRQVVGTLFGNDFIEVSVETNCFTLTVNSTSSKIWGKGWRLISRVSPVMPCGSIM